MPSPTERAPDRLRTLAKWAVAAALLAWLFYSIPLSDLAAALRRAPLGLFIGFAFLYVWAALLADAFATWVTFRLSLPDVPIRLPEMIGLRGATYLLSAIHYAVGQGGLAYAVSRRHAVGIGRSAGAVILTLAINVIMVTLCAFLGAATGGAPETPLLRLLVYGLGLSFPAYLVVIAIRPRFLAGRTLLRPLFDAGLRGHALSVVARLPHIAVLILGHFAAMRLFGVAAPFSKALALLPLVFIAGVLPISPSGLGTSQATAVALFAPFAVGASLPERKAAVLAYSLGLQCVGLLVQVLIGALFVYGRRGLLRRPGEEGTVDERAAPLV